MCRFFHLSILFVLFSPLLIDSALAFDTSYIKSSGVNLSTGYRSDEFEWSISGDAGGENPNILSELDWDDVEILQFQATGWLTLGELPLLKQSVLSLVNFSFGKIISGDVRDSDYATDNRNAEWSRSVNDADEGLTIDLSGAFGPIFELKKIEGVSITPLLGYGFNMQALTMTNGEQIISDDQIRQDYFGSGSNTLPDVGKFSGLDSSYTAYWYGPWLGVNIDYQASDQFKICFGAEYHWIEYFAQADWNLRSEFSHPVSFEHEAQGTGMVYGFQGEYLLNDQWSWIVSGNVQNWKTESGSDRTYFTNDSVGLLRLNQVQWESYALTTGVLYQF